MPALPAATSVPCRRKGYSPVSMPYRDGVLVAAQGGGDETVVNEITYAVQVLFDVPVHKIKVVKMSSR